MRLPRGLTACQQLTRMEISFNSPVLAKLQSLRYLGVWSFQKRSATYWTQLTALTELRLQGGGGPSPRRARGHDRPPQTSDRGYRFRR